MASLPNNISPTTTVKPQTSYSAAEVEQLKARIAELETKQTKRQAFNVLVSAKGAISIYGLGRFPITFYWSQLSSILDRADMLQTFAATNWDLLEHKPGEVKPSVPSDSAMRVNGRKAPASA